MTTVGRQGRRIARVFPRRTNATPTDELAFTSSPGLFPPEVDEVRVSVAFTWDMPRAEYLARQWEPVAPVRVGGPATGARGEEFVPGMYLKPGYVITSRGCPNRCWFCSVWRREGNIRELPVMVGTNVLDDNLLACSREHVERVFDMLEATGKPVQFTGGFEAARFRRWHAERLGNLRLRQVFFAYDTPDDLEPLRLAGQLLRECAGLDLASRRARCYVLIGHQRDTLVAAEHRLLDALKCGFVPMAMLYRDTSGQVVNRTHDARTWHRLQREWARPAIIARRICEVADD